VLIGQPLKSVVEAQAMAAQTTVDFIHSVGFKKELKQVGNLSDDEADWDPFGAEADPDLGELRQVTFKYTKDGEDGEPQEVALSVPFLSILPIPLLRVEETIIEFNAKLTDVHTHARAANVNTNASASYDYSAKAGAGGQLKLVNFGASASTRVSFRAGISTQHSSNSESRYTREYRMRVYVRAVQDDIPAGLGKVFQILEDSIREKKSVPATQTP
jgi:hypothetical protein